MYTYQFIYYNIYTVIKKRIIKIYYSFLIVIWIIDGLLVIRIIVIPSSRETHDIGWDPFPNMKPNLFFVSGENWIQNISILQNLRYMIISSTWLEIIELFIIGLQRDDFSNVTYNSIILVQTSLIMKFN